MMVIYMKCSWLPCLQKQLQPPKDILFENYSHLIIQICSNSILPAVISCKILAPTPSLDRFEICKTFITCKLLDKKSSNFQWILLTCDGFVMQNPGYEYLRILVTVQHWKNGLFWSKNIFFSPFLRKMLSFSAYLLHRNWSRTQKTLLDQWWSFIDFNFAWKLQYFL